MTPAANAAGVRDAGSADDSYFDYPRPELRERVPEMARRVLDVGCGAGAVGAELKRERPGIEVVGVELFADAAARARQRLDAVIETDLETLEALPFDDGSFDAMIFADVLEHLRDPYRLLRTLRRYLSDSGVIVVSLPNVKHWSVVYPLLVLDQWRYADAGLLDRTHQHFFTLEEIGAMFAAVGFAPLEIGTTFNGPMPPQANTLINAAARAGADRDEVAARLNAYQYLLTATPVDVGAATPETEVTPAVETTPAMEAVPAAEASPAPEAAVPTAATTASLLVVLDGSEAEALRCLTAISELGDDEPEHEIVIVADGAPHLDELLGRLDGDVAVERIATPVGFAAAATQGLARCTGETVVLLHGAPAVAPGFLAPLVGALVHEQVAAAAAVGPSDPEAPAVATSALAVRRGDLPARLQSAPRGMELAALCTQLARRGEVVTVPTSVSASDGGAAVAPPSRTVRRAPGLREVELSIVIPTLDAAGERTRRCVSSVQTTTDVDHEIIVIDNGAPPQGFTAPVNAGLRAARGRYLLVLNDDVELLPGWWEPLRDRLDLGASVVFPHTLEGPMRRDFAAWCFALSRDTLEELSVQEGEFFDPEMVVWFQDTDLLKRLRDAGRPPRYVPASKIRHLLSATVESDDPELRAWVSRQVRADKEAFEAKHGTNVAGAAR
ncbi:MAG TPA: glycosyltransferase [Conexibacter sp.]